MIISYFFSTFLDDHKRHRKFKNARAVFYVIIDIMYYNARVHASVTVWFVLQREERREKKIGVHTAIIIKNHKNNKNARVCVCAHVLHIIKIICYYVIFPSERNILYIAKQARPTNGRSEATFSRRRYVHFPRARRSLAYTFISTRAY